MRGVIARMRGALCGHGYVCCARCSLACLPPIPRTGPAIHACRQVEEIKYHIEKGHITYRDVVTGSTAKGLILTHSPAAAVAPPSSQPVAAAPAVSQLPPSGMHVDEEGPGQMTGEPGLDWEGDKGDPESAASLELPDNWWQEPAGPLVPSVVPPAIQLDAQLVPVDEEEAAASAAAAKAQRPGVAYPGDKKVLETAAMALASATVRQAAAASGQPVAAAISEESGTGLGLGNLRVKDDVQQQASELQKSWADVTGWGSACSNVAPASGQPVAAAIKGEESSASAAAAEAKSELQGKGGISQPVAGNAWYHLDDPQPTQKQRAMQDLKARGQKRERYQISQDKSALEATSPEMEEMKVCVFLFSAFFRRVAIGGLGELGGVDWELRAGSKLMGGIPFGEAGEGRPPRPGG